MKSFNLISKLTESEDSVATSIYSSPEQIEDELSSYTEEFRFMNFVFFKRVDGEPWYLCYDLDSKELHKFDYKGERMKFDERELEGIEILRRNN